MLEGGADVGGELPNHGAQSEREVAFGRSGETRMRGGLRLVPRPAGTPHQRAHRRIDHEHSHMRVWVSTARARTQATER